MADDKKPESLLVMPVTGKYCEIISSNGTYQIWKVHPRTPTKFGTLIPYEVGVYYLGKLPSTITLVPAAKCEGFTNVILDADKAKIKDSLSRGGRGTIVNYNNKSTPAISAGDPEAMKKTLDLLEANTTKNAALESQLASQVEKNKQLESQLSELSSKFEAFMKSVPTPTTVS